MLRVEQLRSKKNELASLVVSRKRKLSQLYYATVNSGDLDYATVLPTHHDREKAFWEANNPENGHEFHLSTLPPRLQIIQLPRQEQPTPTLQNSTATPKTHVSTLEALKPSSDLDVSTSIAADLLSLPNANSVIDGDQDIGVSGQGEGFGGSEHFAAAKRKEKEVKSDVRLPSIGDAGDPMQVDEPLGPLVSERSQIEERVESPRGSPGVDPSKTTSTGEEVAVEETLPRNTREPETASALPPQQACVTETTHKDTNPLLLAPLSTAADPQSSPASTNDPGSSNTPDPTAGSPTTSPGDEQAPTQSGGFSLEDLNEGSAASFKSSQVGNPHNNVLKHRAGGGDPTAQERTLKASEDIQMALDSQPPLTPSGSSSSSTSVALQGSQDSKNRKPTMRIDTHTHSHANASNDFRPRESGGIFESPAAMTTISTTRRLPLSASSIQSPPERITRISSGAIRHKSVSEILGETPKPSPQADRSMADSPLSAAAREAFESAAGRSQFADRKEREKERSKLSTVVFAKQPQRGDHLESMDMSRKAAGESAPVQQEQRDYLHTLFESKAYSPPRSLPLTTLLQSAHKTISTADHLIDYQEQMNCRTLKRIYQLQNANRWPLRQMQRAAEPARPTSHWDFVLDHAKWMRTDFREERKWKLAAARGVAEWCAEWVLSSPEQRRQLQVRVKPPRILPKDGEPNDVTMEDLSEPALSPAQPTPDLIASAENESVSEGYIEEPNDFRFANAPAAIFSLGPSEFSFPIHKTPAAEKLLNELPFYQPARIEPDMSKSNLAERLDARWKNDILPISRFATGKIRFKDPSPPSKRSRYEYEEDYISPKDISPLPPEQTNVALFMPENKHIRDRIHPGHSFRPPSEYPMPSQSFFESRTSSQWTHTEDDELRKLVKDYSYNWSLISSCLSPKSSFFSGADRRTPWECFERWIGLEGLPADMSKTPYFKAYHSRIEAAGRHVIAQQEAAQRQAGNNVQITPRKRTTQPVRVERKRTQKHLAMLDAMRKLAKKRETALQKQQHAADLAAMRKVNEANQPKPPISTPAEFSRLKHEREVKMAERQELYRQQVLAHQKAALQQRSAQQLSQANGLPNGVPRPAAGMPNGTPSNPQLATVPNGHPTAGPSNQPRPHPGMSNLPNGSQSNAPLPANMMGVKGMTQAQMQANLAARGGMPNHSPEHMRVIMEANRLHQHQQYLAAQARHVQQVPQQNGSQSSPNMHNATTGNTNSVNNSALVQGPNGIPSPSITNGSGNAGSPRLTNGNGNGVGQQLSSGHIPPIAHLAASIQARNPEMSPEEVQRVATQQLTQQLNSYQKSQAAQAAPGHPGTAQQAQRSAMNQAALNAAAGAVNAGAHAANNGYPRPQGMMTNEQVQAYNQQLRHQQAMQRANGGMPGSMGMGGIGATGGVVGMVGGMTGSPVLNMARPVSQHASQGQLSRSATPRDQRSGSHGGVNGGQGSPRGGGQGMQT